MKKLLCLREFNEGGLSAKMGDLIDVEDATANHLLDSWPSAWSLGHRVDEPFGVLPEFDPSGDDVLDSRISEIVAEAIDAPPVDKMISAPARAKGKRK
jgi:hypothetical protein